MIALPKTTHQGVGGARFELKSVWLHNLCGLHNNEGSLMLGVRGGEGMGCGAGQERTLLGSHQPWLPRHRAGRRMPSGASRGQRPCRSLPRQGGRVASRGPKVDENVPRPRASGFSDYVVSCHIVLIRTRTLGMLVRVRSPFQSCCGPQEQERDHSARTIEFFTFQSSKVPLKVEITRERRCLLPQWRKITLSRGFCNYIHLK